ncbi:hypothetical protein KQH41_01830 [bacterium]|nr:hypothetical protein [bacterium]
MLIRLLFLLVKQNMLQDYVNLNAKPAVLRLAEELFVRPGPRLRDAASGRTDQLEWNSDKRHRPGQDLT